MTAGNQSSRSPKLTTGELMKMVSDLPIRYTMHALERMRERKILQVAVSQMLRGKTGQRMHDPARDELERGRWKYRIHGADIDHHPIGVAVAIENEVVVVTVFRRAD